jgi:FAD/FMN-containing dehydrogenase
MATSVSRYQDDLFSIVGPGRVFFDEEILQLYARDLGNPPKTVDFLINRKPDAVVIPKDEAQIVKVLQLATAGKIPVTPRAAATSGYGGAVPAKGGIVVDLTQLNKEITVDAANHQVIVDPAVLILDLEKELNRYGLALMAYPTSAPSATIGGHVCQGGVGLGAFQYGAIANHVLAARIVLPNGEVKTFSGKELEVVSECEGITGIVTKLTLRVVPRAEKVPVLAIFDTAAQLAATLEDVAKRFRPWNITFHNPTFSMLREEAGGPKTVPRKKFSALLVFEKSELDAVKAQLTEAITKGGGKLQPDAVAAQDWAEIFNTLRAKSLGPSLAPGEVVFPLSKLGKFLSLVDERFDYSPLSIEGTLIQGGFVTILAFALEDERRMMYPLGFSAGIQVLKIGKELGGRAYAPGVYLANESKDVFGNRRYSRIVDFKRAVDKSNIMNPGKIIGIKPRGKAILLGIPPMPAPAGAPMSTVAQILNAPPAVWAMSKAAPMFAYAREAEAPASEIALAKSQASVQGGTLGKKLEYNIYTCSQCGFCRRDAPMSQAVGFEFGTPSALLYLAKLYIEGKLEPTKKLQDMVAGWSESFIKDEVCPSRIPITMVAKEFRNQLELDLGRAISVPAGLRTRIQQAEAALAEREKRFATMVEMPKPVEAAPKPHGAKPAPPVAAGAKPPAPPTPPAGAPGAGPKPTPSG